MSLKNNSMLNSYIHIHSMSQIKEGSQACSKVTKLSKSKELSLNRVEY